MKRILILSGVSWNATIQRHHAVAKSFIDNGYKVLFVQSIPSSKFTLKNVINVLKYKTSSHANIINPVYPNLKILSLPFLWPDNILFRLYNKVLIFVLLRKIGVSFDTVINYLPVTTALDIIAQIKCKYLIYDCVRNFRVWDRYSKNIIYREDKLISLCNFIWCDSFFLKKQLSNSHPIIRQFVHSNFEFKKSDIVKSYDIVKIAYIGTISEHIDCELLNKLVDNEYIVNIYGIVEPQMNDKCTLLNYRGYFSDIDSLINKVKNENDAIIIPYVGNMDGVFPAKLALCLKIGLPIFISSFFDSKALSDYLYVYDTHSSLLSLLNTYTYNVFEYKYDLFIKKANELYINDICKHIYVNDIKSICNEKDYN